MKGPKEKEQPPSPPPKDEGIGQKAVEVGLITAAQLREVLLELSETRVPQADVATILISKGFLSAAQVDALSGAPLKRLGKYRIVRELGRGGMGVVYEAEDTELGRRVALKMLLGSLHSDPQESALEEERFIREARLSANLPKHPQIIGVYEAGLLEGRRFIAMEFVEARQFSDWRRQGSITLRQQITVLRDTAMAVDHAHRHGIVHRDLKPANILVDRKNHPHVADFGLAKRTNQTSALSLTTSGMVMGTPAYMSPEQAHGGMDIDQRTDVWAIGVMLYEVLTGRLPFDADSPVKILVKAVNDPVPPPSTVLRGPTAALDAAIEAICMKALSKDPDERYPSGRALAADLSRWLKGERVSVLVKAQPSLKALWIGAAAAAVVVGALALWYALSPSAEEKSDEQVRSYLLQGRRRIKEERYSDAIVEFGKALELDPSNSEARAGRKEAEQRLAAASRPAPPPPPQPPDPAKIHEAIRKELAEVDTLLSALRTKESFGAARELLAQAARRRTEDEWTTAIASRLEGLRKSVDESFAALKLQAVSAKKAEDAGGVASATARVKGWQWPGLPEELDLALASVRPTPPPPAPPPPPPPPPAPAAPATQSPPPAPAAVGSGKEVPMPAGFKAWTPITGAFNASICLAFSPDGMQVVSCDFTSAVDFWDLGQRVLRRKVEKFGGRSCAWSPDGRWVAGGGFDGTLCLWDAANLSQRTLTTQAGQLTGVQFTPDSKLVVTAGVDNFLRIWDVQTALPVREIGYNPGGILSLSLSPDGRFAAVGCLQPVVRIIEIATGKVVKQFESVATSRINALAYAPSGKSLILGTNEGTVSVLDAESGIARILGAHAKAVRGAAWSAGGRWMATVSEDPTLRLWDAATGAYSAFAGPKEGYFCVSFSPKGDLLAAGCGDWTLSVFEVPPAKK